MTIEHKVEGKSILITGSVDELLRVMEGIHRKVNTERQPDYLRQILAGELFTLREYERKIQGEENPDRIVDVIETMRDIFGHELFTAGYHRIVVEVDLGDKFGKLGGLVLYYFANRHACLGEDEAAWFIEIQKTFQEIMEESKQ